MRPPASPLLALPLLACKPAASPLESLPPPPIAEPAPPASSSAQAELPPPPPTIYGHVRVPSVTAVLAELRDSALPAAQRAMLGEPFVRSLLAGMLAERSAVAEHVMLDRPMGCVVTSPKRHEQPLACVVGYEGGLPALVEDLGPSGYVSGTRDHAHYRFDAASVYLVAMDDHVAFSFAPELVALTRDRLQRDVIDPPPGKDELVATVYPDAIFADAENEVLAFLDQLERSGPPGDAAAMAMQRQLWLSWGDLERAELWLDLDAGHVRLGYRGTARPGTDTERAYAAARELVDAQPLLPSLPAESLALVAMRLSMEALFQDPIFGAAARIDAWGGTGPDSALAEHKRRSNAVWRKLGTAGTAMALLHEPGTKGGLVIAYRLRPDTDLDPVAEVRTLLEGYRDAPEITQLVDIRVRPRSIRVGKIRGDAVTVTPTAALRAQPRWSTLEQTFGKDAVMQVAYAQQRDVLFVVVTTQKADRYLRRAIAAADGKRPLSARGDARPLLHAHGDDTMMATASFAAIVKWLHRIGAFEVLPSLPPERLDDLVLSMRPGGERQREVVTELSPGLIEALFELGG